MKRTRRQVEEPKTQAEMEQRLRLRLAKMFSLPPNDERFLRLTVREAAEVVTGMEQLEAERLDEVDKVFGPRGRRRSPIVMGEEFSHPDGAQEVRTDEAARALADTPHLTGDAEWDAMELEATDPGLPPLKER